MGPGKRKRYTTSLINKYHDSITNLFFYPPPPKKNPNKKKKKGSIGR